MGFPRFLAITGTRCAGPASLSRLTLLLLLAFPGSPAWADGPTATVTAPANGSSLSGVVTVSADVTDQVAQVTGVQFLLDGFPVGALLTQAPYQFQWDTGVVPNGQHSLAAEVTDSRDNTLVTNPESITVANLLPDIVFISPSANVEGTVTVAVEVTDSAAPVTQVEMGSESSQLYFNEGQPATLKPIRYPYQVQWDTLKLSNDQYEWVATATDAAGHKATAAVDGIIVGNFPALHQPTITITNPANGNTVSGSVVFTARVEDGGTPIRSVIYRLDGYDIGSLVTKPPYKLTWDTTTVPDGLHAIEAFAANDLGSVGESKLAEVYVVNRSPPSVTILAPLDGATVSGAVQLSAMAMDTDGHLTQVVYMLNGSPLGRPVDRAPYVFRWNTQDVPNGAVTLTAVATNDARESGTSEPVTVTVLNKPCKGRSCLSDAPTPVRGEPLAPP